MMKVGASLVLFTGVAAQPGGRTGKSTIASAHPMESMEFLLKYLPVAVAEDNGVGNSGHGATQGRTQTVLASSYSAPNCQLFSKAGSSSSSSKDQSMTPNGVGSACSYKSGQTYGSANQMWKVYANNEVQCCNACVSTSGCAAATFTSSSNDHSGGQGPQSWEGFGIHLPNVLNAKTTGGISVDELEAKYAARIGDHSKFDAFMDYSTAFWTYDLQHYIDIFKADGIKHFLGQWKDGSNRQWYSMIFLVPQSTYVIELISQQASGSAVEIEQRMSDALCSTHSKGTQSANNALEAVSINRASSDLDAIDNAYSTYMKMTASHTTSTRHCFKTSSGFDVCFTNRGSTENDSIFSVKDHEDNMWAIHAGVMGTDPTVTDKMTDSHGGFSVQTTALETYFSSNDFATLLKNRLAYACAQSYVIDPTGYSIQAGGPGGSSFPGCGYSTMV